MYLMSLNIFNVPLLEDENEDKCIICQEGLGTAPTYKLPECKHEYHTHCIVTWFRHRPSTESYPSDGSCPLCGNKGINHISKKGKGSRYSWRNRYSSKGWSMRIKEVIKAGEKEDAPKQLKKAIIEYKNAQENLKEKDNALKEFKKNLKNIPGIYSDTQKEFRKYRDARWRANSILNDKKEFLANFPIVPIIIPLPIDIN